MPRDHIGEDLKAATTLADRSDLRERLHRSLVLAALDNIVKYDDCPVLRAACRARSFELTDGEVPQ